MRFTKIIAFVFLLGVTTAPVLAGQSMPEKKVLMSRIVSLPSNRVVAKVIRIEFPRGFRTPEHIHQGPGPRYVLEGRIRISDRQGSHLYGPGEVFWETGDPMVAENAATGVTTLLIFEMAPQR